MRTTLTLDEDVAAKIDAERRRTGKSLKETINSILRAGLLSRKRGAHRKKFEIHARDLGELRLGLSLDSIGDLVEQLEGPTQP